MWQDKNDFEPVASSPESPLKSLKSSAAASIRGNDVKSSSLIKHFCGTKKIHMTVDQHHSSGLLKNLLLNKHSVPPPAGTSFSLSQIQHMQNSIDPRIEENSSDDELSLPDERHEFLDAPTQIDGDLHNNDTHVNW